MHPSPFVIDVATAVTTTTVEGLLGQNIPQKPWWLIKWREEIKGGEGHGYWTRGRKKNRNEDEERRDSERGREDEDQLNFGGGEIKCESENQR